MLIKTKMIGLLMAVALTSPILAYADNGDVKPMGTMDPPQQMGQWHHGHKDHLPSIAKVLNLSEDQEKQLKDLHQKQKEAMKGVFEQVKSNREAFFAEISKAAPDMNKITDIQTQFKTLQSQMVDSHLNSLLEIKKILTPEQFAGFMALKKEREMMMHRAHKGHGHWGDKRDQGNNGDQGNKGDDAPITEDQD